MCAPGNSSSACGAGPERLDGLVTRAPAPYVHDVKLGTPQLRARRLLIVLRDGIGMLEGRVTCVRRKIFRSNGLLTASTAMQIKFPKSIEPRVSLHYTNLLFHVKTMATRANQRWICLSFCC